MKSIIISKIIFIIILQNYLCNCYVQNNINISPKFTYMNGQKNSILSNSPLSYSMLQEKRKVGKIDNDFVFAPTPTKINLQPFLNAEDIKTNENFVYSQNLDMLNKGLILNQQMPLNTIYNFSNQPPEFLMTSAKIDYDLIRHGMERSKQISQKFNFLRRSSPPCAECIGIGIFCDCDDILLDGNFQESAPIIMPMIKPIMNNGKENFDDECYLLESCGCKRESNCNCSCPCKCQYTTKLNNTCPQSVIDKSKRICNCKCPDKPLDKDLNKKNKEEKTNENNRQSERSLKSNYNSQLNKSYNK